MTERPVEVKLVQRLIQRACPTKPEVITFSTDSHSM